MSPKAKRRDRFAGLIQILKSDKGIQIFREYSEGFLAFPRSVISHFNYEKQPIGSVTHLGGIPWSTPSLSPALIGIGYIIGPQLASINVAGGLIAWWILIPLLLFFDPDLPREYQSEGPTDSEGNFRFSNLPARTVRLFQWGGGFSAETHATPGESGPIILRMQAP